MYQSAYFIEKTSQTFADNLAAFGLASVLSRLAASRSQVLIEDIGIAFAVKCDPPLEETWVDNAQFFTGPPFLATIDKNSQQKVIKGAGISIEDLPIGGSVLVDYENEKARNAQYFEWLKNLSKDDRKAFSQGLINPPVTPHPDWDLFRSINPASLQMYNGLAAGWWQGRENFSEMIKVLLCMTSQVPNNIIEAEKGWEGLSKDNGWPLIIRVSASQLFNPSQGKGTNAGKAVWSSPNNLKSFWMVEWLKVEGLRQGGYTKLLRKTKDRKTYVLMPARLSWGSTHLQVMQKFRKNMASGGNAIQLDVLSSLRYTHALLEHVEESTDEDLVAKFLGHPATHFVQGFQMAFYKDLGNSIATMNIASIGLPRWVQPKSIKDFQSLREALLEHDLIIRTLDESRSEQYDLLKYYRDFISASDMSPFFRFASAYSGFHMRQVEKRQFSRPFSTTTLEVLFMNSDDHQKTYSSILLDPGFRNIAYAIRHSTVIPQGRKARKNRPSVQIRYGLGQQLARKAAYPQDFLAEISEFLQLYNAENAQLRENNRNPFRKNVSTQDYEALVQLVDTFGSKVVCNMLIAYGYAREPFEKASDEELDDYESLNTSELEEAQEYDE